MVLDFSDAFMSIPLAGAERPFQHLRTFHPLRRTRPPIFKDEAVEGHVVVWRVLGFGGKSNPLTYSRCAGLAALTAQRMLRPAPGDFGLSSAAAGRVQLYVDDSAVSCLGSSSEIDLAFDLVILWWSTLGIPLALGKGSSETGQHK